MRIYCIRNDIEVSDIETTFSDIEKHIDFSISLTEIVFYDIGS